MAGWEAVPGGRAAPRSPRLHDPAPRRPTSAPARRRARAEAARAAPFPAIDDAFAEAMRARDAASFLDPTCSPQALARARRNGVKYQARGALRAGDVDEECWASPPRRRHDPVSNC